MEKEPSFERDPIFERKVAKDIQEVLNEIKTELGCEKPIILYGSYSRGTDTSESDLDLSVPWDSENPAKWIQYVEKLVAKMKERGYKFDHKIEDPNVPYDIEFKSPDLMLADRISGRMYNNQEKVYIFTSTGVTIFDFASEEKKWQQQYPKFYDELVQKRKQK
ncbi:nucleotidyltransferase domain-containing protein [Patescibacteria group bacterium]|nr:nucleotidyltransferase domain-containing protein [Patescibacteria group bacterium]